MLSGLLGLLLASSLELDVRLFLVGDAGSPAAPREPVLAALQGALSADPARSYVVYLGDNVYPAGLPGEDDPKHAEMERRLDVQVDAVRAAGTRGLMVPGNHDWHRGGPEGWDRIRRQAERVLARGGDAVAYAPRGGCPGPVTIDLGQRVRLVALDSQWWLHRFSRPLHPSSSCAEDSEEEVLAALRTALAGAGDRQVVVITHHPPASGGRHGGQFGIEDHLFPLREAKPWLWVPLPLVGSLYPAARRGGITDQDLSGPRYAHMVARLESVLRERPPLAWVGGHEHNLQVLAGRAARLYLVSGAGILGHTSKVRSLPTTRYRSDRAGFLRLDVPRSGAPLLQVELVSREGRAETAWATPIEATP